MTRSGGSSLLPIAEALARILGAVAGGLPRKTETIPVEDGHGRVLTEPLVALRTQPPHDVSAMDGYALRAEDTDPPGRPLVLLGESAAGRPFTGSVGAGEAIRIFTGAYIPAGADTVLIQEQAQSDGQSVRSQITLRQGADIRRAGIDFRRGDILLESGQRLNPGMVALAASMNHATIPVACKPRIALLSTGDELVEPGVDPTGEAIVASNLIGVAAMVRAEGGEVINLGIAQDRHESIVAAFEAAQEARADCLVTIGGASAGRHDLVRPVAQSLGAELDFYKIAMRPGKPLNFGKLGPMLLLGLPGNPVAALVCATLFLRPLVLALQGDRTAAADRAEPAVLGDRVAANTERQDYIRVGLRRSETGQLVAFPARLQDSSLLNEFAHSDGLLIRPPHAPAAEAGTPCRILRL